MAVPLSCRKKHIIYFIKRWTYEQVPIWSYLLFYYLEAELTYPLPNLLPGNWGNQTYSMCCLATGSFKLTQSVAWQLGPSNLFNVLPGNWVHQAYSMCCLATGSIKLTQCVAWQLGPTNLFNVLPGNWVHQTYPMCCLATGSIKLTQCVAWQPGPSSLPNVLPGNWVHQAYPICWLATGSIKITKWLNMHGLIFCWQLISRWFSLLQNVGKIII